MNVPEIDWPETVLIAYPRGFCAGVDRAIHGLKRVQELNPGRTVYSYHDIIHNDHVANEFRKTGVQFVGDVTQIPEGETLVFSAHGVSPKVEEQARRRNLTTFDLTCPLVEKTHREAVRWVKEGYSILYIGHEGHDETVGTLGEIPLSKQRLIETVIDALNVQVEDPKKLAMITQTTLSQDETARIRQILRKRYPEIVEPSSEDICYATQHRQDGVKLLIGQGAKIVVAFGSKTSSNSRRLAEVARDLGVEAIFINHVSELSPEMFMGKRKAGLTSGASAPEDKFQEVVEFFRRNGTQIFEEVRVPGADESRIKFALPKNL